MRHERVGRLAGSGARIARLTLNNGRGPWRRRGDGLYWNWDNRDAAVARLAVDNSLLAFECSPYSFHSFIANRKRRQSATVFFYRSVGDFVRLWGLTACGNMPKEAAMQPERRVCLPTGAGGRLGSDFCRRYRSQYDIVASTAGGHSVAYQDTRRRRSTRAGLLADVTRFAIRANLADDNDLIRMVDMVLAVHGHVDLLVNAAVQARRDRWSAR